MSETSWTARRDSYADSRYYERERKTGDTGDKSGGLLSGFKGLDLFGLGKAVEAIPDQVYARGAETVCQTFEQLVAPITQTTTGLGRYLRQKFDTWVLIEQSLATFALEKARVRAEGKARRYGKTLQAPAHPKSFIKGVEEASKETNAMLHDMWANLLASQLVEGMSHPHFVEVLSHFSPDEAKLLLSLVSWDEIGDHGGGYLHYYVDRFKSYVRHAGDGEPKLWTHSCTLLLDFGLADLAAIKSDHPAHREHDSPPILFRTEIGTAFLQAASE